MKIKELRKRQKVIRWLAQCLLVFVIMLVFLFVLGAIRGNSLITALGTTSIGSTAFLAFVAHNSPMAKNKSMIGGYFIAIIVGVALHYLANYLVTWHWSFNAEHMRWFVAASATTLTMMIMTLTDYMHAPAAGLSLGIVLKYWGVPALLVVIAAVFFIAILKAILEPWLMNLCDGKLTSQRSG